MSIFKRGEYFERLDNCTDDCRWKCLGDGFTLGYIHEAALRAEPVWQTFYPELHGDELRVKVEELMEDAWGQD